MKYQEILEINLPNSNSNEKTVPVVFFKPKNIFKNINSKSESKKALFNREKEDIININKNKILQFTEKNWFALRKVLSELTKIKMALMTSSVEIEKIFETPLSYLRINVNFFKI